MKDLQILKAKQVTDATKLYGATEKCDFKEFGVFVECASNSVPTISTLKKFVSLMSKMGYNTLYLGTADTYQIEGEPYFGYLRGRYTKEEIKELDSFCIEQGIELVPAIQALAHLHFLPNYADYRDYFDAQHILLVDDDRTYTLIDKMFATMAARHTTRRINIGMDEAFLLGVGKFLEKFGYEKRMDIMLRHLNRVLDIADKYGFKCEMWSDMFFRLINGGSYDAPGCKIPEDILDKIPKNVRLVYWNYLSTNYNHVSDVVVKHKKLSTDVGYAGGLWKWIGFAPDNTFSIGMGQNALDACKNNGIESFTLTLWADNGGEASLFSILPSLFWYGERAHGRQPNLQRFYEITGVKFDDFIKLDLLNNPTKKPYKTLNNKHYWYLYNDILLGVFDSMLSDGLNDGYKNVAKELAQVNGGEYGYLFSTLSALANVMGIKAELGKNILKAYKAKDTATLSKIAEVEIPLMVQYINDFFNKFQAQWYAENKSFGFEVQCIRLGGLAKRAQVVAGLLKSYLAKQIGSIEELEAEHLPFGYDLAVNEDGYIDMTYTRMITNGFI